MANAVQDAEAVIERLKPIKGSSFIISTIRSLISEIKKKDKVVSISALMVNKINNGMVDDSDIVEEVKRLSSLDDSEIKLESRFLEKKIESDFVKQESSPIKKQSKKKDLDAYLANQE